MNIIKEIEDSILMIDIEIANTEAIKASLIASKVELLRLLTNFKLSGKK